MYKTVALYFTPLTNTSHDGQEEEATSEGS